MNKITAVKRRLTAVVVTAAGMALAAGQAAAALPASVATTVTAIQTDGQAIFDLIFPVVGLFLGLVIVIKLFKRFGNKV
jgi:hypothetical protein